MTDDQINDIASKIYGTLATEQEVRFARSIEKASRRAALEEVIAHLESERRFNSAAAIRALSSP